MSSSPWNKVKGLFWQSGDSPSQSTAQAAAGTGANEMTDAEFAALLEGSPLAVPKGAHDDPAAVVDLHVQTTGEMVQLDFQHQYDLAGIPDTDEVEQLENFLARLDSSLPHVSRIAAAQAFLGAIGKDKDAVLRDAEQKIRRVRAILLGKQQETEQKLHEQQAAIDRLQEQIEAHRSQMQQFNRDLEGVRAACLQEESRLQAARVFFGSVDPLGQGTGR
ncbi:MAG: hypothetical protein MUF54_06590 [Polyangiaceae bacterium]|nr:hypothetical protein [Polyangiaceae bacterium]